MIDDLSRRKDNEDDSVLVLFFVKVHNLNT